MRVKKWCNTHRLLHTAPTVFQHGHRRPELKCREAEHSGACTDLFSALVRLPVHSLTSRGHSHGHSHSFCSILKHTVNCPVRNTVVVVEPRVPALHSADLWQLRQRRSTVLQAQNAKESHVSFTIPAKALVPGILVRRYLEQWLPWTRLVRSP